MNLKNDKKYEDILHYLQFKCFSPDSKLGGRKKKYLAKSIQNGDYFLKTISEHSTAHVQKIFVKNEVKNDSGEFEIIDAIYPHPSEREEIIKFSHLKLAHAGRDKLLPFIQNIYYWKGIKADVETYLKLCEFCTSHKGKNKKQPLKAINIAQPRERLQYDITKLPRDKHGYIGFASAIDCHTKYFRFLLIKSEDSIQIGNWLKKISTVDPNKPYKKVWNVYQSDNGTNLNSHEINSILEELGAKHINSAPYTPSTNGQIERPHGTIKDKIAALVAEKKIPWSEVVKEAVFIYNTSVHSSTRYKPWVLEKKREAPKTFQERKISTKEINQERMKKIHEEVYQNLKIAAKRRASSHNKAVEFENIDVGGI